MNADTKTYEVSYLFQPDIAEDAVFGEAGKITGFIQDAHGVVGRIEEPKKRRLAYPIDELQNAYFGYTVFTVAPERLGEINAKLKGEKSIVRHMITEEVKRPVQEFRPRGERGRRPSGAGGGPAQAFTPQAPKEEDVQKFAELDKKLDEILGGEETPAAAESNAAPASTEEERA
ncbi:30S ribosomal protein S6 [Candidatus Parcubacteria bacterium]|nr:MAG: 30S ribosomal protein S6 [Candidatus Parcubacteria bacterium]